MPMKSIVIAVSALALSTAAVAGSDSDMKMSKSMMKTQKMCAGMTKDAMMANDKCKAMAAAHPEMMNSDGSMMMPK